MNNNNNNNLVKQKKIFEDAIELDIAIYFIAICIIGIIIYNKCYTNYIAECKGYIFNNYLYMIISILHQPKRKMRIISYSFLEDVIVPLQA